MDMEQASHNFRFIQRQALPAVTLIVLLIGLVALLPVYAQVWVDRELYFGALPMTLLMAGVAAIIALFIASALALLSLSLGAQLERPATVFGRLTNFVPLLLLAPVVTSVYGMKAPILLAVVAGIFPGLSIIRARLAEQVEGARTVLLSLGASQWDLVYYMTLPRLRAALLAAAGILLPAAMLGVLIGEMALGERTGNLLVSFAWQGDLKRIGSASLLITVATALPTLLLRHLAKIHNHAVIQTTSTPRDRVSPTIWRRMGRWGASLGYIGLFWFAVAAIVDVPWFMPNPTGFLTRLYANDQSALAAIFGAIGRTLAVSITGAALAFGLAGLIVYSIRKAGYLGAILQAGTLVTEVTPIIVFIPLIALACGRGILTEVVVVAVASFFPLYATLQFGTNSVSKEAVAVVNSLSRSVWKEFRFVRLPAAFPYLGAAVETVVPKVILGSLLGQYLITREGLGAFIYESRGRLDFFSIWLAIVVLGALSALVVSGAQRMLNLSARARP